MSNSMERVVMAWVVAQEDLAPPDGFPEGYEAATRSTRVIFPLVGEDAVRHAYITELSEDKPYRRMTVAKVTNAALFRAYVNKDLEGFAEASSPSLEVVAHLNVEPTPFTWLYRNAIKSPAAATFRTMLVLPEEAARQLEDACEDVHGVLRDGSAIRARVLPSLSELPVEGEWYVVGDETQSDREARTLDAEPVEWATFASEPTGPMIMLPGVEDVLLYDLAEFVTSVQSHEGAFAMFPVLGDKPVRVSWVTDNARVVTATAATHLWRGTASTTLRQKYDPRMALTLLSQSTWNGAELPAVALERYFGMCVPQALLAEHPFVQEPEVEEQVDLLASR